MYMESYTLQGNFPQSSLNKAIFFLCNEENSITAHSNWISSFLAEFFLPQFAGFFTVICGHVFPAFPPAHSQIGTYAIEGVACLGDAKRSPKPFQWQFGKNVQQLLF